MISLHNLAFVQVHMKQCIAYCKDRYDHDSIFPTDTGDFSLGLQLAKT